MARLVKPPTLDSGLGNDPTVGGIEPHNAELAWESLSSSFGPSPFKQTNKQKEQQNSSFGMSFAWIIFLRTLF